ncbi:MAG: DUF302 domain-containing protein [Gammaproteobacteria bacterium]|nr:DUF302 domain-containing protein [Gammaproteobacteria bacterium]
MALIRNLLSLIGILSLILCFVFYDNYKSLINVYIESDDSTKVFIQENIQKLAQIEQSKLESYIETIKTFEPEAYDTYIDMFDKLLATGNSAEASIWRYPVAEGLSVDDVVETMKFVANERNIANVAFLPLSKDIEAKLGKPYRHISIYMFCNSLTAAAMVAHNDAYSAFLPCRITLIEDEKGKLWLYSANMDMMIYGGKPLPKELFKKAIAVKDTILAIMKRGSLGEF